MPTRAGEWRNHAQNHPRPHTKRPLPHGKGLFHALPRGKHRPTPSTSLPRISLQKPSTSLPCISLQKSSTSLPRKMQKTRRPTPPPTFCVREMSHRFFPFFTVPFPLLESPCTYRVRASSRAAKPAIFPTGCGKLCGNCGKVSISHAFKSGTGGGKPTPIWRETIFSNFLSFRFWRPLAITQNLCYT